MLTKLSTILATLRPTLRLGRCPLRVNSAINSYGSFLLASAMSRPLPHRTEISDSDPLRNFSKAMGGVAIARRSVFADAVTSEMIGSAKKAIATARRVGGSWRKPPQKARRRLSWSTRNVGFAAVNAQVFADVRARRAISGELKPNRIPMRSARWRMSSINDCFAAHSSARSEALT